MISEEKATENQAKTAENSQEKAQEIEQKPQRSKKKKDKKDPWELSATTLNQKYTLPSGKEKHFDAIDESKVAVGGIRFKTGSGILDPFGSVNLASAAEARTARDEAESEETSDDSENED